MDAIILKKIGVVYTPPSIVLLYSDNGTYKKRNMPLRDLNDSCDCHQLANRLKTRHKKQLENINIIRLEKLIRLAQENLKGNSKAQALKLVKDEFSVNPGEDLNKLSDKELQRRKDIMDLNFEKNSIPKGHPDYVYDKEVEYEGHKVSNEWDTGSEVSEKASKPVEILESSGSNESTPINSPLLKLKTMSSASKNIFGLNSPPPSDDESESKLPQPPVSPPAQTKEIKSLSAGENDDDDHEDDFW